MHVTAISSVFIWVISIVWSYIYLLRILISYTRLKISLVKFLIFVFIDLIWFVKLIFFQNYFIFVMNLLAVCEFHVCINDFFLRCLIILSNHYFLRIRLFIIFVVCNWTVKILLNIIEKWLILLCYTSWSYSKLYRKNS